MEQFSFQNGGHDKAGCTRSAKDLLCIEVATLPSSSGPACWRRVLGIFAKQPRAGLVKSRLAAESSPEWAARLAGAFLLDLIERLSSIDAHRVLAFWPREAEGYFAKVAAGRFALMPQHGADLGQRLGAFFLQQLEAGAERVVLLGTDSPTLPLAFVEEAFRELDRADVVLGPATDGGYYLIGCGRRLPPIFEGIAWGGPQVLAATVSRLVEPWRLAVLPPWYDVDTLDDWWMLQGHLAAWRRAGTDPGLRHTTAVDDPPGFGREAPAD